MGGVRCRNRSQLVLSDRAGDWRCPTCQAAADRARDEWMAASRAQWEAWQAQRAEDRQLREEAFAAGDYQITGQVVTFTAEAGGGEWLIPDGGTLEDAEPVIHDQ